MTKKINKLEFKFGKLVIECEGYLYNADGVAKKGFKGIILIGKVVKENYYRC